MKPRRSLLSPRRQPLTRMTMIPTGNTFRTGEPFLHSVLEQIHGGAVQLPDFQRPWVWDDLRIRKLLASVSQARPIGAAMLLETGGDEAKFAPRLFHGVKGNS